MQLGAQDDDELEEGQIGFYTTTTPSVTTTTEEHADKEENKVTNSNHHGYDPAYDVYDEGEELYNNNNNKELKASIVLAVVQYKNMSRQKVRQLEALMTSWEAEEDAEDLYPPSHIEYHEDFCIDRSGDRQLAAESRNADIAELLKSPSFDRSAGMIGIKAPSELGELSKKCWNCGQTSHSFQECTLPKDRVAISANRKQFLQTKPKDYGKRFFEENPYPQFKAGVLSDTLKKALGMREGDLPPYFDRMKRYGFPPGYGPQKPTETSGLVIYGIDASYDTSKNPDMDIDTVEPYVPYPVTPQSYAVSPYYSPGFDDYGAYQANQRTPPYRHNSPSSRQSPNSMYNSYSTSPVYSSHPQYTPKKYR